MKLSIMRRLDAIVGRPACFALSVLFGMFGTLLRRKASGEAHRVLFIELSEMGSTILAAPSIQP